MAETVTLSAEDFSIDEQGNLRIHLDKARELLNVLKEVEDTEKTLGDTPTPKVKVEM